MFFPFRRAVFSLIKYQYYQLMSTLHVCNMQLRQAKTQVASATQNAMRFMFGSGSSTSPIAAGLGDSPSNSGRRLSMMGSPSRLLSRGSPSSSQNGHSGRHSRQSSESTEQRPILLPWKERVLSSSSLDSPSQSPQSPVDSPSH